MVEFRDFAIAGELIESFPESERWFELIDEPYYKKEDNPNEKDEESLIFPVKLSNGAQGKYYPNRTSSRRIAILNKSTNMSDWKNKKYLWGFIEKKNIFGGIKTIIYVTDFYPKEVKV